MSDLISRQSAIDALDVLCQEHRYKIPGKRETYSQYNEAWQDALDRAEGAIFNLPSAQPTQNNTSNALKSLDCIDRQAAIDAVGKYIKVNDNTAMIADVINAIVDLEQLPSAQPEQRWIPCSERLPEERGFYLTTTKDKSVYCDYWNEDNFDRTEMVIAWMPLPEAYRGEI